jgi:hypothetical protein
VQDCGVLVCPFVGQSKYTIILVDEFFPRQAREEWPRATMGTPVHRLTG